MATTPYSPVQWSPDEPIYTRKLNTMTANDQWLFENMPRLSYRGYNNTVRRTENTKIMSGAVYFTAHTTDYAERTVEFGTFFSTACNPIIIVGGVVTPVWAGNRVWVGARGFGGGTPDHRGFTAMAGVVVGGSMALNYYVPWIAVGF